MRARLIAVAVPVLTALAFAAAIPAVAQGSLELLTTGPTSGPVPSNYVSAMASADARHVFFETRERLVPQDQDGGCLDFNADDPYTAPRIDCVDVYERSNGQTSLVSFGGNGPYDTHLQAVSSDGSKAFFTTFESLLPSDANDAGDVYQWSSGSLELVTAGATRGANQMSASEDGSKVFFEAADRITADDHNDCGDIYVRSGGQTSLVSTGPDDTTNSGYACGAYRINNANANANARAVSSPNGDHFFFYSDRPLVARSGRPHEYDLYERAAGQTRLISTGPIAGTRDIGGPAYVNFLTASPDGSRVFFRTNDPLVPEDTGSDVSYDIYEADSAGAHLLAPADVRSDPALFMEPLATSYDGSRVFLWTNARLAPNDFDNEPDIYQRSGGTYSLISTGPTDTSGGYIQLELFKYAFSRDGSRVFFETEKPLVPEDTNDNVDLYLRAGGVTTLVTAGTPGYFGTVSITPDGRHAFLYATERLLPEDTDSSGDVYEWDDGTLKLLDIGVPTNDPIGVLAFSPDARRLILNTPQALTADDNDTLYDLYAFDRNRSPDCAAVTASRSILWPPNGSLRIVELAGASDPDGDPVSVTVTGVTQDEPLTRRFDAALTTDPAVVRLRAQRAHRGDGRVYRVAFTASDGDASCSGTVRVAVPKRRGRAAVDSAPPSYDSLGP